MTESTDPDANDVPGDGPEPTETKKSSKYDRSIVEGPLGRAVWKIAWPTMLTNAFAGMQGMVDHVLVGNLVGYKANAAIGVSFQLFLVVIVFISSLFTGMAVLVARFAGAHDEARVNRTVYQAFLTAVFIAVGIMAPVGYFASPYLLDLVNADPGVKAEALPFIRVTFVFSIGLLIYFMTSGALRSAGDARTPMALGIAMTLLNLIFNLILIRGLGPIPAYGTMGAAMGTSLATGIVGAYAIYKLWSGGWVVGFPRGQGWGPDWKVIRSLFKFGLPAGIQGIAMNVGGVLMLAFIGSLAESAAAQAAFAVSYTQLFSLVTWTSVGLMGAAAAVVGQNIGAGHPDRANKAVGVAARYGMAGSAVLGIFYFFLPQQLLALFGMTDPEAVAIGVQLLRVLAFSGLFISVALTYTGGLQGSGDTKSPLYISIISQVVIPLGICFLIREFSHLEPIHIWLAILAGHATRCVLSVVRFMQGKWRNITVDIEHTVG
ncbi:MAG: MATE family efflux transporter [Pyrinomonadaceae bacterium]|nr:MATE family efflux transporter [Pyrinomonadaceae bacterium]MBP6213728.1 MATE family efflux transporter [Pyrinomonadaceae bacterium]